MGSCQPRPLAVNRSPKQGTAPAPMVGSSKAQRACWNLQRICVGKNEQVAGAPLAFKVHFTLTHFGTDQAVSLKSMPIR
jgi:hypothetical protein